MLKDNKEQVAQVEELADDECSDDDGEEMKQLVLKFLTRKIDKDNYYSTIKESKKNAKFSRPKLGKSRKPLIRALTKVKEMS